MKFKERKGLLSKITSIAIIGAAGVSLAACGGSGGGSESTTTTASSGGSTETTTTAAATTTTASSSDSSSASSQELIFVDTKDCGDINPHLYDGNMVVQGMVFEPLVLSGDSGIEPCLAKEWTISDDGKKYTFKLRDDVSFTNGEKFNAEVAKANIDAVQSNKDRHSWMGLAKRIDSVEAVDEYTLDINLTESYYPTLSELSLCRPYRFQATECLGESATDHTIGTGAYRLTENVKDQYAVLESNEDYWGGAPAIKKITRKVMPEGQTTLLALEKGEVNFLFSSTGSRIIDSEAVESLTKSDYQMQVSDPISTRFLLCNTNPSSSSPITDKNVRLAFWQSIDREALANDVYSGADLPAYTLMYETMPYCNIKLEKRALDVEAAKKLLDDAGWKDDGSGKRSKDGKPLELTIYYFSDNQGYKSACELIQSNAKDAGITVNLVAEESSVVYDRRKSGDFDLIIDSSWGLPYEPHNTATILLPEGSYAPCTAGLDGKEELFDDINKVITGTDETERQELYTKIFTKMHDEASIIPLTYTRLNAIAPKNVTGMHFVTSQYEYPFKDLSFN